MLSIDLHGKAAVVTGGSRGVGRAVALMLADAGCDVGITYQNRVSAAEGVVADLQRRGVRAWAEGGELGDPATSERIFGRARHEFGGLDIFVGNAGIWPVPDVPIAEMTDEQWRRTLQVNLDSIFYTTRAAARLIRPHGRIVLISSTAGQRGEAYHADYAATKGAIISLVKGLCIEMASQDVTVNCVAPGWIDTEMCDIPYANGGRERVERGIPLGRVAAVEDVAGPVVFLCSPLARHITGEVVNVNGGSVLCG
ncbi:MAG TPA: SDR family oxidoreductase [Longimicrobiales bacterium]